MVESKMLYIMISKTDTGVGGIIRRVTGFPYNHVSMTLDPSFRSWVSFARFHRDTPLYGGFLIEPAERFFAKGKQVDIRIFALELTAQRYGELEALFAKASTPDSGYIYNYFELVTLIFGIKFPVSNAFTCLGFANHIMGTEYVDIKELNREMEPMLYYQGTLNALVPDSGDRSNIYFSKLGLAKGLKYSAQMLSRLFKLACAKPTAPTTTPQR